MERAAVIECWPTQGKVIRSRWTTSYRSSSLSISSVSIDALEDRPAPSFSTSPGSGLCSDRARDLAMSRSLRIKVGAEG